MPGSSLMLPPNTLFIRWKKEQKECSRNLTILQQNINQEAIHNMRVAIKKLNAYASLYLVLPNENGCTPGEEEKLLPHTHQLFEITGRQRDLEICLALLRTLQKETGHLYAELRFYFQSILKTAKAWTNEEVHRYKPKEVAAFARLLKEDKSLDKLLQTGTSIKAEIEKLLTAVPSLLKQPHLLRKQLKLIYYWHSLLSEKDIYKPALLHNILDDLGNWQDYEVLGRRISHFRKDYLPRPFAAYSELRKLEALIAGKKKALLVAGRKKIKNWLEVTGTK
jgi:CHAD domain-containing protein